MAFFSFTVSFSFVCLSLFPRLWATIESVSAGSQGLVSWWLGRPSGGFLVLPIQEVPVA